MSGCSTARARSTRPFTSNWTVIPPLLDLGSSPTNRAVLTPSWSTVSKNLTQIMFPPVIYNPIYSSDDAYYQKSCITVNKKTECRRCFIIQQKPSLAFKPLLPAVSVTKNKIALSSKFRHRPNCGGGSGKFSLSKTIFPFWLNISNFVTLSLQSATPSSTLFCLVPRPEERPTSSRVARAASAPSSTTWPPVLCPENGLLVAPRPVST